MTFISYAQNFEDVMLWRALKHVENGFYIDVGANDPTLYSVTRAFYDRGWHGINLEPVSQFFERLSTERPRDINLQMGAGATEGSFPFFDIPDSGLATSDAGVANMHRKEGWDVREIQIQVLPLTKICNRHVNGDIHFLKIDVEGAEREVLLGMDFQKWRPWIVVVEATVPMSKQTAHESWDSLIVDSGYDFVYFDGLNRYYVAAEHAELKPAFSVPPNVFDGFMLNTEQESKLRVSEAEARAHQSRLHAMEAERRRKEAETQAQIAQAAEQTAEATLEHVTLRLQQAENLITAIYASKSWRVTAPLRWLNCNTGHIRNALRQAVTSPRSFALRVVRFVLRHAIPVIKRTPFLLACAQRLRYAFPATAERIIRSLKSASNVNTAQAMQRTAVIQDDLPAWGGTTTRSGHFKAMLQRELHRRAKGER